MKKRVSRKNILKEAGILLIAVFMACSSLAVTANTIDRSSNNSHENHRVQSVQKEAITLGQKTLSDILLSEGFEDGIMPPPGGWTKTDGATSTKHWEIANGSTAPTYVHTGAFAAQVKKDLSHQQDESLISPEIDITDENFNNVTLTFWAYSMWSSDFTVELRINDDIIWDMKASETGWTTMEYRQKTFNITSYVGDTIKIKWRYTGIHGKDFALDDILVDGTKKVPPQPPIIKIGNIVGGGKLFTGGFVAAEIKNIGLGNASNVNWSITVQGGIFHRINVSATGILTQLQSGNTTTVKTSDPIYGLGKVSITVTAREPDFGSMDNTTVEGFVFFFKVMNLA